MTNHLLKLPMQFFAEEDPAEKQQEQSQEKPGGESEDNGLPKTQQELDALIEKRLARERRKLAKQQGGQATPPAAGNGAAVTESNEAQYDAAAMESLNRELLISRAQLAAIKDGVADNAAEDAVLLAVMAAEKAGEADEDGVRDALRNVLKRHPEWKHSGPRDEKGTGIKLGADAQTGAGDVRKGPGYPKGKVFF